MGQECERQIIDKYKLIMKPERTETTAVEHQKYDYSEKINSVGDNYIPGSVVEDFDRGSADNDIVVDFEAGVYSNKSRIRI